ncbi:TfoX/Sxy family DNA transformation protein [endosymbiont 'TC1' of Trimyema compressum]|nr:TfoX/Sxy family DNA transformation protein [endosymbiont 'TC1' of Trimyema compressum]
MLLSENGLETCLSNLFALEGAVENIRWHYLSSDRKKN